ncbi:ureidoglycolate lyase [Parasulfitobacter algicola]|uniref:Ureidoglycolate lyase n=1 Tax=Parasulfitobacter algicola TaxID=2614809 RepID=A0ABX2IQM9_9RHOB|nr:ureidoglycolate lyase [Sulfitobacter algicola]
MIEISPKPLTSDVFSPYGDVLQATGEPDKIINQGLCGRFHDCASLDFSDGLAGISIFNATPRHLPLVVEMLERHPMGSQAFIPMTEHPFLVVVALDDGGKPVQVEAFLTVPGQAVNYHKGTWHGVLTPLHAPGLFAVVDRIGSGANLDEYWLTEPVTVLLD